MEEKKKNYSPWKMWGSWIGLIIGMFASIIFLNQIPSDAITFQNLFFSFCGFSSGYGIHSLIRRFKK